LTGSAGGMLRIAHRHLSKRCLVRGFHGQIIDVAFANISREVIVAVVDEMGGVYVYTVCVDGGDSKLKYPFTQQPALVLYFLGLPLSRKKLESVESQGIRKWSGKVMDNPQQHLDPISSFAAVHFPDRQTDQQIDTHTD